VVDLGGVAAAAVAAVPVALEDALGLALLVPAAEAGAALALLAG
jgi:hypothetical protein